MLDTSGDVRKGHILLLFTEAKIAAEECKGRLQQIGIDWFSNLLYLVNKGEDVYELKYGYYSIGTITPEDTGELEMLFKKLIGSLPKRFELFCFPCGNPNWNYGLSYMVDDLDYLQKYLHVKTKIHTATSRGISTSSSNYFYGGNGQHTLKSLILQCLDRGIAPSRIAYVLSKHKDALYKFSLKSESISGFVLTAKDFIGNEDIVTCKY